MSEHKHENPQGHQPEVEIIVEIIDIEEHAKKHGTKPPKARRYIIRVDREKYTVEVDKMTGREILTLAKKIPPERYLLNQKFRHGHVKAIGLDDLVDFCAEGVERFTTLPKDQTEGLVVERRQEFKLPEDDSVLLDVDGRNWETISGGWLLVHDFEVPPGYNVSSASVAIQIPSGYPTAALDMAYFYPWLNLANGRQIPCANATLPLDGKSWQRWSRHYSPQNPWLPGEYNITTHLRLVHAWLERELNRN